jgi:teichoic acid transport system ATP-binding protein
VEGLTKVYKLYQKPSDRLREALHPLHKVYHKDFYALRDVTFCVGKGETLGIIGVNGSGKSTALKIITGVLTPSAGSVEVKGTVSALLELGAGFNMDYTGIENIYMNGVMMGFGRKEMDEKLDGILAFAGIGEFVHQPVKTYSSGMFVRLAFALAISVEPDILIVDEALSVGDVFFQAKCYRKMREIRENGTTVLMVTHDMGSVMQYCDKVVLLNQGHMVAQGSPKDMVDLYKKILAGQYGEAQANGPAVDPDDTGAGVLRDREDQTAEASFGRYVKEAKGDRGPAGQAADPLIQAAKASSGSDESEGAGDLRPDGLSSAPLMKSRLTLNPHCIEYGDGRAEIADVGLFDERGELTNLLIKGEYFTIKERIRFAAPIEAPIFTFTIKDKKGVDLSGTNTLFEGADVCPVSDGDEYVAEFRQKMTLQGGEYLISVSCTGFENGTHTVYHRLYDYVNLTVISNKNTVGVYDMESQVRVEKMSVGGQGR